MRREGRAVHPDAMLFTEIIKTAFATWLFRWTGKAPFQLFLNGTLRLATDDTEISIRGDDNQEPPALEVLDANNTNTAQNILYPPYLNLQWYGDVGVDQYKVEENIDGTWTQRNLVRESNLGYYRHQTEALTDVTAHSWRTTALTAAGNVGTAETFDGFIARNPPPPVIEMIYSDGTLTVRAR